MYQICEKIRVKAAKIKGKRRFKAFFVVRGTGLEFKKRHFLQLIPLNFVIYSSEMIKHGTSQSSCFIRANAIKGTNKGKIKAQERAITQWKLHIANTETTTCRI